MSCVFVMDFNQGKSTCVDLFYAKNYFSFMKSFSGKIKFFVEENQILKEKKKSISLRKWADSQKQTEKLNSCANESEAPAFNKYY